MPGIEILKEKWGNNVQCSVRSLTTTEVWYHSKKKKIKKKNIEAGIKVTL